MYLIVLFLLVRILRSFGSLLYAFIATTKLFLLLIALHIGGSCSDLFLVLSGILRIKTWLNLYQIINFTIMVSYVAFIVIIFSNCLLKLFPVPWLISLLFGEVGIYLFCRLEYSQHFFSISISSVSFKKLNLFSDSVSLVMLFCVEIPFAVYFGICHLASSSVRVFWLFNCVGVFYSFSLLRYRSFSWFFFLVKFRLDICFVSLSNSCRDFDFWEATLRFDNQRPVL